MNTKLTRSQRQTLLGEIWWCNLEKKVVAAPISAMKFMRRAGLTMGYAALSKYGVGFFTKNDSK